MGSLFLDYLTPSLKFYGFICQCVIFRKSSSLYKRARIHACLTLILQFNVDAGVEHILRDNCSCSRKDWRQRVEDVLRKGCVK